jgi:hypothetical protein
VSASELAESAGAAAGEEEAAAASVAAARGVKGEPRREQICFESGD